MPWVREGYCCRCGECCVGTPPFDDDTTPADDLVRRAPSIPGMCPLLAIMPDGLHGCLGHEPPNQHWYYLAGCNVWPMSPDNIANYPSCTYTFRWVNGDAG